MRVSTSRKKIADSKGKIKVIQTKNYDCETCHVFVRSEDIETQNVPIGDNDVQNWSGCPSAQGRSIMRDRFERSYRMGIKVLLPSKPTSVYLAIQE